MTSEEIKAAVERLMECDSITPNVYDVTGAFMDDSFFGTCEDALDLRTKLIELLEQADPHTHMELPKDADGLTWHIGDAIEDGTVIKEIMLSKYGWYFMGVPAIDPSIHRHLKPTVEDVLCEYAKKLLAWHNDCDPSDSADDELALVVEYAEKLREVMS